MSLSRKALNFDLDTKELEKHFKNTADAYSKTERGERGHSHRQINDLDFHNSASQNIIPQNNKPSTKER